jgi:hypothetical protein
VRAGLGWGHQPRTKSSDGRVPPAAEGLDHTTEFGNSSPTWLPCRSGSRHARVGQHSAHISNLLGNENIAAGLRRWRLSQKAAVHAVVTHQASGTLTSPPEKKFTARATRHERTHPMVLSQLRSREVVTCHGSAAATPLNLLKGPLHVFGRTGNPLIYSVQLKNRNESRWRQETINGKLGIRAL